MVIKIVGVVAVLASSYVCGLYYAKKSWFRNQDLEQLKKALTIFNGEVLYSSLPIDEIFNEVGERTTGVVSMLFDKVSQKAREKTIGSMNEIWNDGVIGILPNSYFTNEDLEYIFSFGRTLGYADKNQQANNVTIMLGYIETAQEELREKKSTEERLYKTLGVMCGLMISIVLF